MELVLVKLAPSEQEVFFSPFLSSPPPGLSRAAFFLFSRSFLPRALSPDQGHYENSARGFFKLTQRFGPTI